MHFNIAILGPRADWFTDLALPCRHALAALGHRADIHVNRISHNAGNIVFGAHSIPDDAELPAEAIIYNFEQISSPYFTDRYVRRLREARQVWDYSPDNIAAMRERWGVEARHVFPGYVPEMSCLSQHIPQDIDVLFYGTTHPRRAAVLDAIRKRGINVLDLQAFGPLRDYAIARSSLVINIHHYVPASLEVARLGFLWANSRAVLSESCPEFGLPAGLEHACTYVPYDDLADAAELLIRRPELREQQARRGFEAFSAIPLADILEDVVGRAVSPSALPLPDTLNLGSGRQARNEWLNLDINAQWGPDIVADLSLPLDPDRAFPTRRFGDVRLKPGMFRRIIVHDVLEHVADLKQMMTNILDLLEIDGRADIAVPHDLSPGAWQDPTHVRAFNENSWKYWCEWHWYMGWRDHRFEQERMEPKLSSLGEAMRKRGAEAAEILRTPRATDSLHVVLRKRETTAQERMEYDLWNRSFYRPGAGLWAI